ncbi:MAG: galactose ABC transporter substrate-binding protein [Lachnospiraceae bacterium]|nr:galactose ABC transporter substrate-binding protein [Lachnospiraceae bacterium]
MNKTRKIGLVVVAAFTVCVVAVFAKFHKSETKQKNSIKIGVSIYESNDTFVDLMVDSMEEKAKKYELETGIKVNLDVSSAKESQRTQNEQIKRYISLNYDVICVNLVDRTNASTIIDAAMDKNIPIVFFNREPVAEDIFRWENIYYVGTDAKATAVLQGQILIDAYNKNPEMLDKNGDGKLQYVMLEGEMGHQDSIIRTEWSVQTLIDYGMPMEKIESAVANWQRNQGAALMEQWINTYGKEIEVVLCNNDDMALGVCDSLAKANIEDIAVVGIDATQAGVKAVEEGKLLGTVDCNAAKQGETIFDIAAGIWADGSVPNNVKLENERYFRAPLIKVTK